MLLRPAFPTADPPILIPLSVLSTLEQASTLNLQKRLISKLTQVHQLEQIVERGAPTEDRVVDKMWVVPKTSTLPSSYGKQHLAPIVRCKCTFFSPRIAYFYRELAVR